MNVHHGPSELERKPRAVAIGSFDGVHLGHRHVLDALVATGLTPTVLTFDPHPRIVLGYGVELLTTLERRLELLAAAGVRETVVLAFDHELQQLEPEAFVETHLQAIGAEVVVAGKGFRFGHRRRGEITLLEGLGLETRVMRIEDGISSTAIRDLLQAGDISAAAAMLGRAPEVDGTVVVGDERGARSGSRPPMSPSRPDCSCRRTASTPGSPWAPGRRSRSGSIRTTAAPSAGSRRTCSTTRAICTASGSSSSSGAAP